MVKIKEEFYEMLEYQEEEFFTMLEDMERYKKEGILIHDFKQYGAPLYYLVIARP